MINRIFKDNGIIPFFGYLFSMIAFVGISIYIFYKIPFAAYIYIIFPIGMIINLSENNRQDFLNHCFKKNDFLLIRIVENITISLAFILFLIYKFDFLAAFILFVLAIILGIKPMNAYSSVTIPTPFSKQPFEFSIGFRNTFFVFIFAYIISMIAIYVSNFNLGIFALVLSMFTIFSFYTKPESQFYIWIFNTTPSQFLIKKIQTSITYSFILCVPIVVVLSVSFLSNIIIILALFAVGLLFQMTIIVAKYAAYPREMNIPEGVTFALCIAFPPLLLFYLPILFVRAKKRIQCYLT